MSDMAVDGVLWFFLAAMVALIVFGCVLTRRPKKPIEISDARFEEKLDRAA
jgi:hypothetical protein